MLEHRLTVLEGKRLLRVVQTLIGDLIGGWLPGLLRVSATEGAVGQHKLPLGTGADDLEDHPPPPRIIGQVGLHAVAQAGAVASFGLARAKLTGGDPSRSMRARASRATWRAAMVLCPRSSPKASSSKRTR